MKELTMKAFVRRYNQRYSTEQYMVVAVSINGASPEFIINKKENFEKKMEYYQQAYDDNLRLKYNSDIRIIDFTFTDNVSKYLQAN